jgi:DNA replication protein DnaC
MSTDLEHVRANLQRLDLRMMAAAVETNAERAAEGGTTYLGFLAQLVGEEVAAKVDRSVNARLQMAHLPWHATVEEFDFAFQPSVSATGVAELGALTFGGSAGRGKNAPGHWSGNQGVSGAQTRVVHDRDRITRRSGRRPGLEPLGKVLQLLRGQEFLVVDELGYTAMDSHRAALFFPVVSQKYGHSSLAVTTNLGFDQ